MDPRLALGRTGRRRRTRIARTCPWYRTITREQWRVLVAAKFGWMLDAMDFMLYAMAIGQLRAYFGFDDATAGMLGTATLVMSGVGGLLFGYVADRFGRTRALMGTIADLLGRVARRGHVADRCCSCSSGARCSASAWAASGRRAPCSSARPGRPPTATRPSASCSRAGRSATSWRRCSAAVILGQPSLGPERVAVAVRRSASLPAVFTLWVRRHVHEPASWTRTPGRRRTRRRTRLRSSSGPPLLGRTLLHHPARLGHPVRLLGGVLLDARRSWRGRWRRAARA